MQNVGRLRISNQKHRTLPSAGKEATHVGEEAVAKDNVFSLQLTCSNGSQAIASRLEAIAIY